jgi:heme-degrading monooxygenase HmoA
MIVRIWRGATRTEQADEYEAFTEKRGLGDYRRTPGNRGALLLRRDAEGTTEFLVVSLWDDFEAIRRFAGPDVEKAVYYPEDDAFLLGKEPRVAHYRIGAGYLPKLDEMRAPAPAVPAV